MKPKYHLRSLLLASASVQLLAAPALFAVDGSWAVNAGGNWKDAVNWTSNPDVAGGTGSTVNFINDITGARTILIETTSRTVGILNIGDNNGTDSSHGFTINQSGSRTLTFNNGLSDAQLNKVGGILDQIGAQVILASNLVVNASAGEIRFNNAINETGGTRSITKDGAGTMRVGSPSNYSGVTQVNEGTINVRNNTALGTTAGNTIVESGARVYATLALSAFAEPMTISGAGISGANAALQFGGTDTTHNMTGAVTLGANATIATDGAVISLTMTGGINTAGHTVTLAPGGTAFNIDTVGISGAGSVVKNGAGTVTFNATNSHSVSTAINRGTLTVGATGTLSGSTATLTVNNTNNTAAGNAVVLNLSTGSNTTVGSLSGTIATPTSGTNTATINTQSGRTFIVNQTSNSAYEGVIAGDGGFTLGSSSTHRLTLSGINTYTGATKVSGGTLVVNNSIGNSATTVETTGVLTGTGVLGSSLTVKSTGVVNAGTVGTINTTASVTGTTSFESGSIFSWDLSADGTTGDKLTTGSVTGSDAIFRILLADGTVNDSFFNIDRPDFFANTNIISSVSDLTALFGTSVQVYSGLTNVAVDVSSRGTFSLTSSGVSWTAIPEPTSALAGLLLGAGLLRRRRK